MSMQLGHFCHKQFVLVMAMWYSHLSIIQSSQRQQNASNKKKIKKFKKKFLFCTLPEEGVDFFLASADGDTVQ